jgi:Cytochrome c554 and c-prime
MNPRGRRPISRRHRRIGLGAVIGLVIAGGILAAWARWRPDRGGRVPIALDTPYANARPGVAFVGDQACARCHREIAADYRRHPMGRSLATADLAADREFGGESAKTTFQAQGLRYAVERRDGKLIHSEERHDAQGLVVARIEAEIRYILGSGTRGLSYLVDRDGYLFQSPIGWYTQQARWDLSPGYATRNSHFERPIEPDCLACHANRFDPIEGSINRYRAPIFHGLSIGCERCHGPGDLHVRNPATTDDPAGRDLTIVNPRRLEPALREAVCEQCHLQGVYHVERTGRKAADYRPGLPLEEFMAVFVASSRPGGENAAVGHVEQMHASRCYRGSAGRLGCISCHDPHRKPEPAQAATFYRDRCLACHADHGCALPPAERQVRSPADSCVDCHMPRSPLADIAHTAATDHRIPRREGHAPTQVAGPSLGAGDDLPIVLYHAERFDPRDRAGRNRDLAIALAQIGQGVQGPRGARFGRLASPRLEAAVRARPDDLAASDALAFVLASQNRFDEALKVASGVLAFEPRRERVLDLAMVLASQRHDRALALDFGRRTLAVNPWLARYHLSMAQIYTRGDDWRPAKGQWQPAIDACRAALKLDPTNLEARRLLIVGAVMTGDLTLARSQYRTYLGFDPPDAEPLRRWIGSHSVPPPRP